MIRDIDAAGCFDVARIPEGRGVAIPATDGAWPARYSRRDRSGRRASADPVSWLGGRLMDAPLSFALTLLPACLSRAFPPAMPSHRSAVRFVAAFACGLRLGIIAHARSHAAIFRICSGDRPTSLAWRSIRES
jgi:hypothetical protein